MKPIQFEQSNKELTKPASMTDEQCTPLPVYVNEDSVVGTSCLSCWKADWRERLRFLFTGRVWLNVFSGTSQPPVSLYIRHPWGTV